MEAKSSKVKMKSKKSAKKAASKPAIKNDLIKTVSEVEALTFKEKEAFRHGGGTTISNPK